MLEESGRCLGGAGSEEVRGKQEEGIRGEEADESFRPFPALSRKRERREGDYLLHWHETEC